MLVAVERIHCGRHLTFTMVSPVDFLCPLIALNQMTSLVTSIVRERHSRTLTTDYLF